MKDYDVHVRFLSMSLCLLKNVDDVISAKSSD